MLNIAPDFPPPQFLCNFNVLIQSYVADNFHNSYEQTDNHSSVSRRVIFEAAVGLFCGQTCGSTLVSVIKLSAGRQCTDK